MDFLYRSQFSVLEEKLSESEIMILMGPRQVGKTTIMKKLFDDLETEAKIFSQGDSINFSLNLDSFDSLKQSLLLQGIDVNAHKKTYIFIDEFQYIAEITRKLKVIYDADFDKKIKFILSGSNSLAILKNLHESMAGRKRIFYIYPFSFYEFLKAKSEKYSGIYSNALKISNASFDLPAEIYELWEEYVVYGGYPKVILAKSEQEKQEILYEIINSYIQKDVQFFLSGQKVSYFQEFFEIIAYMNSSLVNKNHISKKMNLSLSNIENFLKILEETFIISIINPFYRNKIKEISKMGKVYFIDNGIRNILLKSMQNIEVRSDKSELTESFVYQELLKNKTLLSDIYFWRTQQGSEVDFILKKQDGLIPIEVKFGDFYNKKLRNLDAFEKEYNTNNKYILHNGKTDLQKDYGYLNLMLAARLCS